MTTTKVTAASAGAADSADAIAWSRRALLSFALVWLLFCALMVAVGVQDYLRSSGQAGGGDWWKPVLWESSSLLVGTTLMLTQLRLSRRWRSLLATPWRWFAAQALWLPYYWLLFTPLTFGIRHGVYALAGEVYTHRPLPELLFYESLKITVFIGLFTAVRFGMLSYQQLLHARLRAERSERLLRQAQLQRLARQMQPHFLFNALNTISSLMHSDVDKADATLIELAGVLRAALDAGDDDEALLAAELALVQGYAKVMLARFGERASIDWRIDEAALDCRLPVMSLQPLLENIFQHTVERQRGMTRIVVSARVEALETAVAAAGGPAGGPVEAALMAAHAGSMLRVVMEDDAGILAAAPAAADARALHGRSDQRAVAGSGHGIGLANLRARLTMLHGARASLVLEQLAPAGVRATMHLPCTRVA